MVSIRLPVIEAERIRLFSLRRYSLANTQWCSTCPSSIYSCTLSSTQIWMMPSVKVIPKNCTLSFLNRALMSIRRLCRVVKAKMKNAKKQREASDEAGFGRVTLGVVPQLQSVGCAVVEGDAWQGDRCFLVGEGDGTEFAFIELSAGEIGYLGVHAPLAREVVATLEGDTLDEAFEKRAPTIRHAHCV